MSAFDAEKYAKLQAKGIEERLELLYSRESTERIKTRTRKRLYLEVGGHLLNDSHASRVLPGFDPHCKIEILKVLLHLNPRMILCISSEDVVAKRVWVHEETYENSIFQLLKRYKALLPDMLSMPDICFNLLPNDGNIPSRVVQLIKQLEDLGYSVWKRYKINGYPKIDVERFGDKDEHVTWNTDSDIGLVIVTALGSSCGKLSTCLGQMYLDRTRLGIHSVYAKYELFPIWNLAIDHPIQIAYEAATADVGDGDVVEYDAFEKEQQAVNYNRDNEAFPLLQEMIKKVTGEHEYIREFYVSPTRMGINNAGFCITDTKRCAEASVKECEARVKRYLAENNEKAADRAMDCLSRAKQSLERM